MLILINLNERIDNCDMSNIDFNEKIINKCEEKWIYRSFNFIDPTSISECVER